MLKQRPRRDGIALSCPRGLTIGTVWVAIDNRAKPSENLTYFRGLLDVNDLGPRFAGS
jgi:hypothetical protein